MTSGAGRHPKIEWNVVVTADPSRYGEARRALEAFGACRPTHYQNVLVLEVGDVSGFLAQFHQEWTADEAFQMLFQRVMPVSGTFTFQSIEEFERGAKQVLEPWVADIAQHTYHVRMHRRGFRHRMSSQVEERALGDFLNGLLASAGQRASVDFDDPDIIIAIETVDQRGGASKWARDDRVRYPFLKLG